QVAERAVGHALVIRVNPGPKGTVRLRGLLEERAEAVEDLLRRRWFVRTGRLWRQRNGDQRSDKKRAQARDIHATKVLLRTAGNKPFMLAPLPGRAIIGRFFDSLPSCSCRY